ncbi:MAG: c-type cytochrome [Pseudomonadales bacterium]
MNTTLSRHSSSNQTISLLLLCALLVGTQGCGGKDQTPNVGANQTAEATMPAEAQNADNVDGAELAGTCVACHGDKGLSQNPLWPNLAGQKKGYLAAQINAFRNGGREEPTMAPFVSGLSDAQVDALATYFSELPPAAATDAGAANKDGMNVRANCISCHGVEGISVNQQWPNLAGQKNEYLAKQLHAYRDGSRVHALMNVIASELTDQQMTDVAEYYSQLAK